MIVKAENTISRIKNGKFIIAFTVSPQEHREFNEWLAQNGQRHMVDFQPYFEKASMGQKEFFHKYLRKLAEKMHMTFEETKTWFITSYGTPETEGDNYVYLYINSERNPPEMFKKNQYYFKSLDENNGVTRFLAYKGVSMMNTREMNILIDFLKSECESQGIKIMSDHEYERTKRGWSHE